LNQCTGGLGKTLGEGGSWNLAPAKAFGTTGDFDGDIWTLDGVDGTALTVFFTVLFGVLGLGTALSVIAWRCCFGDGVPRSRTCWRCLLGGDCPLPTRRCCWTFCPLCSLPAVFMADQVIGNVRWIRYAKQFAAVTQGVKGYYHLTA